MLLFPLLHLRMADKKAKDKKNVCIGIFNNLMHLVCESFGVCMVTVVLIVHAFCSYVCNI